MITNIKIKHYWHDERQGTEARYLLDGKPALVRFWFIYDNAKAVRFAILALRERERG